MSAARCVQRIRPAQCVGCFRPAENFALWGRG